MASAKTNSLPRRTRVTRVHPTTLPSTEIHERADRRKRMFDRYGRDTVEVAAKEIFRHSEQFDSETICAPTTQDSTTYVTPKIPSTTSRSSDSVVR